MIDALSVVPSQDRPDTFDADADQWCADQLKFQAQLNANINSLNELFSGYPNSFRYVFDSGTAFSDPGPGKLRFNSATQSAATDLYIDNVSAGQGVDLTTAFNALGAVTSIVKGAVRISAMADPLRWLLYDITTVVDQSGYRRFSITGRARGGSSNSPLISGEDVIVTLQRGGDKGDKPLGGAMVCLAAASVAGVSAINYLNLFTSEYDHYLIDFSEYLLSAGSAILYMRLAIAGAAYTGATHTSNPVGNSSDPTVGAVTALALSGGLSSTLNSPGVSVDLLNTSSNNSPTLVRISGIHRTASGAFDTKDGLMMANINSTITGFQLYASAGVIASGKLRVYGYRNQVGIL